MAPPTEGELPLFHISVLSSCNIPLCQPSDLGGLRHCRHPFLLIRPATQFVPFIWFHFSASLHGIGLPATTTVRPAQWSIIGMVRIQRNASSYVRPTTGVPQPIKRMALPRASNFTSSTFAGHPVFSHVTDQRFVPSIGRRWLFSSTFDLIY